MARLGSKPSNYEAVETVMINLWDEIDPKNQDWNATRKQLMELTTMVLDDLCNEARKEYAKTLKDKY